jgi:pyrroline-5-carboxylate reductase
MSADLKIGFLGAGKMATALATGFMRAGLVTAENLIASDPYEGARTAFAEKTGAKVVSNNGEVVSSSNVLVLAVKPDQVADVLEGIKDGIHEQQLIISIAAGITLSSLEEALGEKARIVRVMPNTPALVGASASAYALGKAAQLEDGAMAEKLLTATGLAIRVKESLLDAVTGLSGSGPAYVFMIIEALSDGGVAAGLPRDVALRLAAQTVMGSAKLVLDSGMHPGQLKDMVASPGGTTIEGIHALEEGGLRNALINAVRAASEKAEELGLQ